MRIKHVAICLFVVGAAVTVCSGCTPLQNMFGVAPTQQQIANCATWIAAQANAKAIPSTQLSADLAQLKATPPTIPADCNGHT